MQEVNGSTAFTKPSMAERSVRAPGLPRRRAKQRNGRLLQEDGWD